MSRIQPRQIRKLLVINRGEIAARILSSARELDIETFAVYTDSDVSHTYNADHAVRLRSPASYMDVLEMVDVARRHGIDAVHPGYGFLSESSDLARQMAEAHVMVVGPGAENLDRTGDKLRARQLAEECGVPVLPAFTQPTGDVEEVRMFASRNGLPVMVKAVDGGGGRGIRLVRTMDELKSSATRAIEESPSKQVFAEKAAVDDFRHVEVQIVGDGQGNVMHLWERECSIQRRYQKIVELAPSTASNRNLVSPVIESAVRMAKKVRSHALKTNLSSTDLILDPILIPWDFRVPVQSSLWRVLLPRNQPEASGRAHDHRVDMRHRHRQGPVTPRTGSLFRTGRIDRAVARSIDTTRIIFHTTSDHRGRPRKNLLAQHRQDSIVSLSLRQRYQSGYSTDQRCTCCGQL